MCSGACDQDAISKAKVAVERHGGTVVDEMSQGLLADNVSSVQTLLADLGPNWRADAPTTYKVPDSRPRLSKSP